jgi:hypothetical protein
MKLHKRLDTHHILEHLQVGRQKSGALCSAFAESSDGLEPSTPSLPCAALGNWSQPTATVLACCCGFGHGPFYEGLPAVATTGLHKGSIVRRVLQLERASARGGSRGASSSCTADGSGSRASLVAAAASPSCCRSRSREWRASPQHRAGTPRIGMLAPWLSAPLTTIIDG